MTERTDPDLLLLIGRMDGKLDTLLTRHDQHEKRIGALEAFKNRALGYAAAVSGAVALLAQYVLPLFKGHN